ncbi:YncE family protein [Bacillus sp. FJAT-45037]|uniref:YncE family protein n=1 Tax=Bacillus sp. FJAT-45037 TaxID=2011007 RepID=UPI000C23E9D0|nr:hypothetical protein [Bacillus sp. FJAT-45037]
MRFIQLIVTLIILSLLTACQTSSLLSIDETEPLIIVANSFNSSISFIHSETHDVLETWELESSVTGTLLLDPDHLLTYSSTHPTLSVYQLSTGDTVNTWTLTSGVDDAVLYKDLLIVTQRSSNQMIALTYSGELIWEMTVGDSPQHLYLHEDLLYVLNYEDTTISVIEPGNGSVVATLPSIDRASDFIIVDDQGWLGGHGRGRDILNDIHLIDLHEAKLIDQIFAPTMPIAFLQHKDSILVLSHGSNELRLIDSTTKEILQTTNTVANPFSMVATEHALFIAGYDSNSVEVLDIESLQSINTISVGEGPIHLTVREEIVQ